MKKENSSPKMRMELIWHNCKTCPPSEKYNEDLLLWDGERLDHAEYDNGYWLVDYHYADITGVEESCWWADLNQTTEGFFKNNCGNNVSDEK